VDSEEGYQKLQQDLDQLGKWAEKRRMEFNIDKCEVLHFGKSNQGRGFTVKVRALRSAVEQRFSESGVTGRQGSEEGFWQMGLHQSGH